MLNAHRQGRITFFMQSTGEEAISIGSTAALDKDDWIYTQYREAGAYLWRGLTFERMIDNLMGTIDIDTKGKSMQINYSYKPGNVFQLSSPLGTQQPQAVGSAYCLKLKNIKSCVATFSGDGAHSEGDSKVAYNMAQTLKCPVMFLCRSNQFAISTNYASQIGVDGPGDNALGYGISTIRVDGCDLFAVFHAVQEARKYCVENCVPVFVELVSYRLGDHSTSDDSGAYRDVKEFEEAKKLFNPIERLSKYFISQGQWSNEQQKALENETHANVVALLKKGEAKPLHPVSTILDDMYDVLPPRMVKQKEQLSNHFKKYSAEYDLSKFSN